MPRNDPQSRYELARVALGENNADLAITNGKIVNVYTGELLTGDTILIKGKRIAYVGKYAKRAIGPQTKIIDASGKTLIPGFIDGHTHIAGNLAIGEALKYIMKGGTTAIVTETLELSYSLGYRGVTQFLKSAQDQPIKIYFTLPPMVSISPAVNTHTLPIAQVRRLLRRKECLGLGEVYWSPAVAGDPRLLVVIEEVLKSGKKLEGHSAGATANKLQAYFALGFSSCHEPTDVDQTLERMRLGITVMIREGEIRRELEAISHIQHEAIDFRLLALATDGVSPQQLVREGYLEVVVQKAIDLGFPPVRAIQMATLNIAQHFGLDHDIGSIAPGRYADILVIPELSHVRPELVISNGQVIFQNGELAVKPRRYVYPQWMKQSVKLPRKFQAADFAVSAAPLSSGTKISNLPGNVILEGAQRPKNLTRIVKEETLRYAQGDMIQFSDSLNKNEGERIKVRVIDQITPLVTKEAILELPVHNRLVQMDKSRDIVKVAAVERMHVPGKTFTGFIKGMGLKRGAIAVSSAWETCDITVAGADENDMALAVNRIGELQGGIVACCDGKILAEAALPISGLISEEPMEIVTQRFDDFQRACESLGCAFPDMRITMSVLSGSAIPYLRICEEGLVNLKTNQLLDLIVE